MNIHKYMCMSVIISFRVCADMDDCKKKSANYSCMYEDECNWHIFSISANCEYLHYAHTYIHSVLHLFILLVHIFRCEYM